MPAAMSRFFHKLAFIAMLLVPLSLTAARTPATETDKLQTELDAINLQIDFLKLKVKENLGRINDLEKKIKTKKNEIKEFEEQINSLNEKQIKTSDQVVALEKEIAEGQAQMKSLMKRFTARLVQLHKIKQGTLLGSVFSAKNLNSFLNRFQMVKYLLQNDKELLQTLKDKNAKLDASSEELDRKQLQMNSIQQELDAKRKKIGLENASLQAMLKTVVLEKKLFLDKEKRLSSSKAGLEKEIEKIEDSRTTSGKSFESELANTAPKVAQVVAAKLPDSAPDAAKVMKFAWPIGKDSIKAFQSSGDDKTAALRIEVKGECEIKAAGRGKVLYKGNISGLGNVIILGHERGFSTVYANIDDIWVGLGQIVGQGETIGRMFGGANSLHFEIRFGGKKQHPITYLPTSPTP